MNYHGPINIWNPNKYCDKVVRSQESVVSSNYHRPNKVCTYGINSPLPGITTALDELPLAFSTVQ